MSPAWLTPPPPSTPPEIRSETQRCARQQMCTLAASDHQLQFADNIVVHVALPKRVQHLHHSLFLGNRYTPNV
jgi:hypothetical protein